jgi:hypothetical protein
MICQIPEPLALLQHQKTAGSTTGQSSTTDLDTSTLRTWRNLKLEEFKIYLDAKGIEPDCATIWLYGSSAPDSPQISERNSAQKSGLKEAPGNRKPKLHCRKIVLSWKVGHYSDNARETQQSEHAKRLLSANHYRDSCYHPNQT